MGRFEIKGQRVNLTPLFISAVVGISLPILAIVFQDGETRGYASVTFLLWTAALTAFSVLTAILIMAFGRIRVALELLASGIILLLAYLVTILAISIVK